MRGELKKMRKKIHILTACVFAILSSLTTKANRSEILFQNLPGDTLSQRKQQPDSISLPNKICSCKLVEVKSDAEDRQLVGIFAEKTIKGKKAGNLRELNYYIERERIYFRFAFLESARKKKSYKSSGNCRKLYKELKKKHANLIIYNIIDVDALRKLAN